ncbi:peroxiredoxin [Methanomassiliicoccales archaeon RumEn M1]|nr:peroxiredoxin [Methanomassiliicoccales archaeon RumEn M1]
MNDLDTRVNIPCIGESFPHIEVRTTLGAMTLPDHFAGKWFILFSHPGDFTPVCTTEFASFALNHERFRRLNCELIGLSVDQVHSHIKWVEWIEERLGVSIEYPIIADANGDVSRTIGAIHPPNSGSTIRAAYIVDPGAVLQSVMYYPRGVGRSIEELLRILQALHVVRRHKVATPANWPSNELIGEEVLLSPPGTMEEARRRKGMQGCLDWWFCTKRL